MVLPMVFKIETKLNDSTTDCWVRTQTIIIASYGKSRIIRVDRPIGDLLSCKNQRQKEAISYDDLKWVVENHYGLPDGCDVQPTSAHPGSEPELGHVEDVLPIFPNTNETDAS